LAQLESGKETKPNYNSVDLSEVELEDVSPYDVRYQVVLMSDCQCFVAAWQCWNDYYCPFCFVWVTASHWLFIL